MLSEDEELEEIEHIFFYFYFRRKRKQRQEVEKHSKVLGKRNIFYKEISMAFSTPYIKS